MDLIRPLQLGDLQLDTNLSLAPMAGFTNLAFRLILREIGGCGLVASEMVAALAMPTAAQERRLAVILRSEPKERPIAMQIYGREPELCADMACRLVGAGADVVDLNCGCPVRKARQSGCGVALMREPERVAAIVAAIRRVVTVPVTVKLRLGTDAGHVNAVTVARAAVDAGVDALFVHARTGESKHGTGVDLDELATVVQAVSVPVVGNGSLETPEAIRSAAATGIVGYQIGRAACANPWIFRQLTDRLAQRPVVLPDLTERQRLFRRHLDLVIDLYGERAGCVIMRKYAGFYYQGLSGIRTFRDGCHRLVDRHGWETAIAAFPGMS